MTGARLGIKRVIPDETLPLDPPKPGSACAWCDAVGHFCPAKTWHNGEPVCLTCSKFQVCSVCKAHEGKPARKLLSAERSKALAPPKQINDLHAAYDARVSAEQPVAPTPQFQPTPKEPVLMTGDLTFTTVKIADIPADPSRIYSTKYSTLYASLTKLPEGEAAGVPFGSNKAFVNAREALRKAAIKDGRKLKSVAGLDRKTFYFWLEKAA